MERVICKISTRTTRKTHHDASLFPSRGRYVSFFHAEHHRDDKKNVKEKLYNSITDIKGDERFSC